LVAERISTRMWSECPKRETTRPELGDFGGCEDVAVGAVDDLTDQAALAECLNPDERTAD
jgi:hypothetical protein